MIRTYKYRLYPTKAQEITLRNTLDLLRELYNAALQERRDAWKKQGITVSLYEQYRELVDVRRTCKDIRAIYAQVSRSSRKKEFKMI